MCDALRHRGPDDCGVFVDDGIALGIRRLSVIDVDNGHQPITTEDGRFTIVFNGEIYNYRDLRACLEARGHRFRTDSDTECLLHAFAAYGPACLSRLNGMFAIAIWDSGTRQLFLARDRVGVKPLYLYDDGRSIWFASEVKALLDATAVPRDFDHEAFAYYLRYGYVAAPATLFRHIRKLPAAHYMTCQGDAVVTRQYWTLSYRPDFMSAEDLTDKVYGFLQQSVRRELVSDVPLGAFLSGGIDSSSIVQLMSAATDRPVNTYSIGFAGADDFYNELPDAAQIAARFATAHHEIVVKADVAELMPRLARHLDQPLADSSFLVTYLLSRAARESVTVALSGVGGDEIFGGYRRYLGTRLSQYYAIVPGSARRAVTWATAQLPVDRNSAWRNLARLGRSFLRAGHLEPFDQYDQFVRLVSESRLQALLRHPATPESDLLAERRAFFTAPEDSDPVAGMQHLDLKTSLPESLLMLTDSMSMATSLEARVPLLDHELVELLASVPASRKVNGLRLRDLQRRTMSPHLPRSVFTKRKWGFGCPTGRWFRDELRELLRDTLAPERMRRVGLLNPDTVQEIISEHEGFREDNSDILLGLLTFELWREEAMG
jgi:asparagine synthase (glutamine-hydrolysing)